MIGRLVLSILLIMIAGCEEPLRPMRSISALPRIIEENYKTQPHYRAFVLGYMRRRDEYRSGMATGHSTVEEAIDAAITRCEEGLEGHAPKEVCGVYYIGDIYVPGMTQEQLDKAIELYKTRDRGQGKGASATSVGGSLAAPYLPPDDIDTGADWRTYPPTPDISPIP